MDTVKTKILLELDSIEHELSKEGTLKIHAVNVNFGCQIKITHVHSFEITKKRKHLLDMCVHTLPNSEIAVDLHEEAYLKICRDVDSFSECVELFGEETEYTKSLLVDSSILITDQDEPESDDISTTDDESEIEEEPNESDMEFIDDDLDTN